jgi:hypothetical protein
MMPRTIRCISGRAGGPPVSTERFLARHTRPGWKA